MKVLSLLKHYCKVALLALCGTLIPTVTAFASDIVVGSWNIKRLGHGNNTSYPALATIASKLDLLAVQEVMTEEGIERLEKELEKYTGESWSYLASHAIGSSSYKEMYAFIWRDSAVEYSEGAVVYLDRGDLFIREPFSAKFKSKHDNSEFALGTVHILYGKGIKDRTPEIKALADYWQWMQEVYPNTPIALMGDFNLPESNADWGPLKKHAKPLITQGATTLSEKPGKYANLYDNIWVEHDTTLVISDSGITDFPKVIGWSHSKSRKHVSDHAPIYMALGNATLDSKAIKVVTLPTAGISNNSSSPAMKIAQNLYIRGNRNSKVYHRPDCPSYNRISEKNQVTFDDTYAAEVAGYRLAGNCP